MNGTLASGDGVAVRFSGPPEEWPSPRGLLTGFAGVFVGQIVVLLYYCVRRFVLRSPTIQVRPPPDSTLAADLYSHVSKPESFAMTLMYLTVVWMFRILPESYFDLESRVSWPNVLAQFLVVDFFIYLAHVLEHKWLWLYGRSHKSHHRWVNPKLYNAFNGAVSDTFCLIVVPLVITSQICHVSCWDFVAFGTLYASQFTLIHSEYAHPWDGVFEAIGVGTAEDHNIHHLLFKYNYGHFFMWWDWIFGTYRAPSTVKQFRCYQDFIKAHPELAEEHERAARRAAGLPPRASKRQESDETKRE